MSVDDAEAIQLMQKANLKAELWGFSRAVKGDIDELVRLNLRASVIEAPTSVLHQAKSVRYDARRGAAARRGRNIHRQAERNHNGILRS